MIRSKIISTGSYLPKKILSNYDLEKIIDTSDDWIIERTGIKQRRISDNTETASDMAYRASISALKNCGLLSKDIDLILVATITPDMPLPSTACILQKQLKAINAAAFDINAACSGFIYGLSIADSFIKTKKFKKILLIGSEILSKFVNWKDKTTCVIFGDGAGAAILEPTTKHNGIISVDIYSNGNMYDFITIPGGGSKHPVSKSTIENNLHYIKMKGNETFKIAVKTLEKITLQTLKQNNLTPSDISLFIPHQANIRIIQAVANKINIPMDKIVVNIDKYGNTSAASIPIALDETVRNNRIKQGDYILLEAFGAGLTWASSLIKW